MIKRIVTLSATAVCLVAALLVIFNFTTAKHAEHIAEANAARELPAAMTETDIAALRDARTCPQGEDVFGAPLPSEDRHGACGMHEEQAAHRAPEPRGGHAAPAKDVHPGGHETGKPQPLPRAVPAPRAEQEHPHMPTHLRRPPVLSKFFGDHGFVLIFLPLPAPPEQPAVPDGELPGAPGTAPEIPDEAPEQPSDELPTVIDESEDLTEDPTAE